MPCCVGSNKSQLSQLFPADKQSTMSLSKIAEIALCFLKISQYLEHRRFLTALPYMLDTGLNPIFCRYRLHRIMLFFVLLNWPKSWEFGSLQVVLKFALDYFKIDLFVSFRTPRWDLCNADSTIPRYVLSPMRRKSNLICYSGFFFWICAHKSHPRFLAHALSFVHFVIFFIEPLKIALWATTTCAEWLLRTCFIGQIDFRRNFLPFLYNFTKSC